MLRPIIVAIYVCSALATTAAWAQGGGGDIPIAVLGAGGAGSEDDRESVTHLLLDAIQANQRLELADQTDLSTEEALGYADCAEENIEECLGEVALIFGVSRLLFASLLEGEDELQVQLRYFDAESGRFLLDGTYPFASTEDERLAELRLLAVVGESVVLRITSDRDDVSVSIDSEDYGQVPVVVTDLEPGVHLITARCRDCIDVVRQVNLESGRFYVEPVSPRSVGEGDYEDPDLVSGGPDYLLPAITLGAGIAMLGTGVAFGIMTNSTQDDFNATPSYDEALRLADEGERQAVLANVFLIGGAAVTAIGGLLFLTADGDESTATPTGGGAASATPTPAAWLGQDTGGVTLHWDF